MSEPKKLGTLSCISLITNKMIGTGLFSTPAIIFKYCSGHVPLFLALWLLGAVIILSGLLIYLEYALNLPFKNGGEKNYLLRVFRRPRGLMGCIYSFQMVFLGFSSGNSFAFGKYIWFAVAGSAAEDDTWPSKAIGVVCITFCIWLHIKYPNKGTSLFNFLGMFKIVILFMIVAIGFLVGIGVVTVPDPNLMDSFSNKEVTGISGNTENVTDAPVIDPYSVSVALLQVIYSFKGWENANYVLSELKDPYTALTITAPLSVLLVTVLYFLVVVSYLVVIPQKEFLSSGVLVAGIFFNKVFGESLTARVLPVFISLSTLGNVMVVSYAHSRVNQELANENYLPFSKYFRNLNHSLLLHWAISVIVLVGPPSTEIYEFVVNLYIYPGTWINLMLTGGLIYMKLSSTEDWPGYKSVESPSTPSFAPPATFTPSISSTPSAALQNSSAPFQNSFASAPSQNSTETSRLLLPKNGTESPLSEDESDSYIEFDSLLSQTSGSRWQKSFSAPWICIFIFLAANLFLAVFPFIPPPSSYTQGSIPYWCFPVVGTGCLLAGAVFFYTRRYYSKIRGLEQPFYGEVFLS